MRFACIVLLPLLVILPLGFLSRPGSADTVYLKNGYSMQGKVTDNRQSSGNVLLEVAGGSTTLRGGDVQRLEMGEGRREGALDMVKVTTAPGGAYYGQRSYVGVLSPESTDSTLVIEVPGGKISMPRKGAEISKPGPSDLPLAATPAAPGSTIKTTHQVKLKNGNVLAGDLLPGGENEPLKLAVNGLGVITIQRDTVLPDGVKEMAGSIQVPAASPEVPLPKGPPATIPEEMKRQLMEELRTQILNELLDQIIGRKVEQAIQGAALGGFGAQDQAALSNDEILEIQDHVYDLTRQRTQNRVRAERHLTRIGSPALPYLEPVAGHPFELARRAVQRIVHAVGDVRGAPMAILALNDSDYHVRKLAGEALSDLLPDAGVRYHPGAGEKSRLEAQEAYRSYWGDLAVAMVREAIHEELARR